MTECNKCGDCCETIYLPEETMFKITDIRNLVLDPECIGWTEQHDRSVIDSLFMYENFKPNKDGRTYHCEKFDKENRLCSIHEDRPPVCRDFPWYNKEPNINAIEKYKDCSFWEDINVQIKS